MELSRHAGSIAAKTNKQAKKQLVLVVLGWCFLFFFSRTDLAWYEDYTT